MRKRGVRVQAWLNKEENTRLHTNAKKAGLSQEGYLRSLINGYAPKELPPPDYFSMTRELHAIGSNLNQIAANRCALLFIRGEHAVMDDKYDILKHPNLKLTVDGGGPPYRHGATEHALDWKAVILKEDGDYELLSEEELESLSPS